MEDRFCHSVLVSEKLTPIPPAEVAEAAERLGVRFPEGYEAFVTTFGEGDLSGYLRIWPPRQVVQFTRWYRGFLKENLDDDNWCWDLGGVLEPDRVVESVAIGSTLDGDTIVFHPSDPDTLYALPRHQDVVYRIGRGLDEAIDWLLTSGKLTRKIKKRLFEPHAYRKKRRYSLGLPYAEVRRALLDLGVHDVVTLDSRAERCLELLVREFGGTVFASGARLDDEAALVVMDYEAGPTTPSLDRLNALLRALDRSAKARTKAAKLRPKVKTADELLDTSPFDDGVMAELAALKGVKLVNLAMTRRYRVTEPGLAHLAKLKSLREFFAHPSMTDAGLTHISRLASLRILDLSGTKVTDAGMPLIADLTNLQCLWLSRTRITDAGMAHLAKLTKLQVLWLEDTDVGDSGLTALAGMSKLDTLQASRTKITGSGLAHLARSSLGLLGLNGCPIGDAATGPLAALTKLRQLWLERATVSDAGMSPLRHLTRLETIDLSKTRVKGPGLAALGALAKLEAVYLAGTKIDDAAMAVFAGWENVRRTILNLNGTRITNAGLGHLRGWTRLNHLSVIDTSVTEAGAAGLKKALPRLLISRR